MKNTSFAKGLLLAALAVIGITQSCNDLDLQPLDKVTTDTYYKTLADFDGATFAAYSSIQDLWGTSTETLNERGEFWSVTLTATDDVQTNSKAGNSGGDYQNARDLDALQFRSDQTCWGAAYTQIYEGILRANLVLEALDRENELTADQKKQFAAEAKFIRGMMHFLALQMWGTPPLVTSVKSDISDLATGNATQDALYASILGDLRDATSGLPAKWDAANTGRATKYAARALEGKVNVWKKDWAAAITALEDVKSNGGYSLFPDYDDAFSFTKENGVESVFEIQYGGPFSDDNLWVFDDTHSEAFKASQGTGRVWYWNPSGDAGAPGGGLGWYVPTKNLVDEYEAGDKRLAASIYRAGDTYYNKGDGTAPYDAAWSETGYSIRKYFGANNAEGAAYSPNGQAGFNNERWLRYAEVLLLYAEALIENNRAADGMNVINNEIRVRAGLGDSPIADPVQALRHERRVELAFEAHRWFDITRWGIGAQVFGSAWNDKFKVFPFPLAEINRSAGKLVQNTGY
jgi:starch-binding outer membrane protein, SusD/RagB family